MEIPIGTGTRLETPGKRHDRLCQTHLSMSRLVRSFSGFPHDINRCRGYSATMHKAEVILVRGLMAGCILCASLSPLRAQQAPHVAVRRFQPGLGATFGGSSPLDEIRDRGGSDFSLSGELRILSRWMGRVSFGRTRWGVPEGSSTTSIRVQRVTFEGIHLLRSLHPFRIRPYLGAGIGRNVFTVPAADGSHWGGLVLAGMEYPFAGLNASLRGELLFRCFGSAFGSRLHCPAIAAIGAAAWW